MRYCDKCGYEFKTAERVCPCCGEVQTDLIIDITKYSNFCYKC